MVAKLRNPDAPASSRQIYKLNSLGVEFEENITMQEASDLIEDAELEALPDVIDTDVEYDDDPFTEAHVTMVNGDQRSGKTTYAVAIVRDAYDKDCVKIFFKKVMKKDVEVLSYDRRYRVAKIIDNGERKLVKIPKEYKMYSPMRIFSRIHLYGIPYVHVPSYRHMLKWLKRGFISNGWLIADEAHKGLSARAGMTREGRQWVGELFEFGKSKLDVMLITHMPRMIEWVARTVPTKRVSCTYNAKTKIITATIKRRGKTGTQDIEIFAPLYWGNYKTNEKVNN